MRLSVLDQSIAVVGRPHGRSIRDTIALAQHCEALGYDRFWVSEHHSNDTIVGTAPEILMAAIAAVTKRIRVGSAGMMLPHYSRRSRWRSSSACSTPSRRAASTWGSGARRAPMGAPRSRCNPLANERPAQFPGDVRDLMAWVTGSALPEGHPFRPVQREPVRRDGARDLDARQLRLRRAGGGALRAALRLRVVLRRRRHGRAGARRCTASCTSRARATPSRTRRCACGRSRPTRRRRRAINSARVPASGCCATAASSLRWRRPRPRSPTPTRRPRRRAWPSIRNTAFVGTGAQVAERIEELAKRLNVQEMAVVTWATDEAVRRRSYQLLAEAMGFAP